MFLPKIYFCNLRVQKFVTNSSHGDSGLFIALRDSKCLTLFIYDLQLD
jgi:hypothetical protein